MERWGAIDIGTNSVRILIGDVENGNIEYIIKEVRTTRLGEGLSLNGYLDSDAMDRTIVALSYFKELLNQYKVENVRVVATSACRDAVNGSEFANKISQCLGLDVDILSGRDEAAFEFAGAINDFSDIDSSITLIDIGGGSTEIMEGKGGILEYIESFPMGAVRLKEMFVGFRSNSLWADMKDYIQNLLQHSYDGHSNHLIGTGGTITSLAAIDLELEVYDAKRIHGYRLTNEKIENIFNRLNAMSLDERKNIKGLQPRRADIILPGIYILIVVMDYMGESKLTVSDKDILEGLLLGKSKKFKKRC